MDASKKGMGWTIRFLIGFVCFVVVILLFYPIHNKNKMGADQAKTRAQLESMALALQNYRYEYGKLPHGDASNIVLVLDSKNIDDQNPRKIRFLEFKSTDLDDRGNFLDAWGHPFVFTFSKNGSTLTIRSLGKDGVSDGGIEKGGDDIVAVVESLESKAQTPKNEKKS